MAKSSVYICPSVENSNTIVLYTKVKQGVTRKLYNYLVTCPGRRAKITVGVEGPYGECCAAGKSQTAVFIAGGNGVPGMFSEIYDLAKRSTRFTETIEIILDN